MILTRTNYLANKVCLNLEKMVISFGERATGWSISLNVLLAIEVWISLQKGRIEPKELLPFSKLIHPSLIKAGRKLWVILLNDLEYNLDHYETTYVDSKHIILWVGRKVLKVSEQVVAYIVSVRRRGEKFCRKILESVYRQYTEQKVEKQIM